MRKILVVDDSKQIRTHFKKILETSGHKVSLAKDAREALKIIAQNEFDLIAVDLHLPDIDGFALCKEIRELDAGENTPIIMITSDESLEIKEKAFESGVSAFFSKETFAELLVGYIESIFKNKKLSREEKAGRVLVVDDSATLRNITKGFLVYENLKVLEASEGNEALKIIQKQDVDVVITDIDMPGMNGIDLIKKIKRQKKWSNLQVIVMTSTALQGRVVQAFMSGANDYIHKPFQRDEVIARVKAHLRVGALQAEIKEKNRIIAELKGASKRKPS